MTSTLTGMRIQTSPVKPACDACGHVRHGFDIVAGHRFNPDVPTIYAARCEGAEYRETREEAEADACARRQQMNRAEQADAARRGGAPWADLNDGERAAIMGAASVLGRLNFG